MDEFTVACARCKCIIKVGGKKVSHGYCQKCFDILIKELEQGGEPIISRPQNEIWENFLP